MFTRQQYIQQINSRFAQIANELAGNTILGFTDANMMAEDFFVGLLNRVFGYEFKNVNILLSNSPGIDLADDKVRVAAQVTSETKLAKIRKTLTVFGEKELHKSYDRLLMVYPVMERPKRKTKTLDQCPVGFDFDLERDELSFRELLGCCRDLTTEKLESLWGWVAREVEIGPNPLIPGQDLTVARIIKLIKFLSDQEPDSSQPAPEAMPDPDGKLTVFSQYRDYLESQFTDNFSSHMPVKNAKESIGYDGPRASRTTAYLRQRSRSHLDNHNNNPKAAFEALVKELQHAVSSSGIDYESSAIRYFLASEMIACNVFPLPKDPVSQSNAEASLKR